MDHKTAATALLAGIMMALWGLSPTTRLPLSGGCCTGDDEISSHGPLHLNTSGLVAVLDQKVEIVIPSTLCPTPHDQCPSCVSWPCFQMTDSEIAAFRVETLALLASHFGGANSYHVEGVWISEQTGLPVFEENVICRSFMTLEQLELHLETIVKFVRTLGRALGQEAMAMEVNGKLLLLKPFPAIQETLGTD